MKRTLLVAALIGLLTLLVCGTAMAVTDPIVCSMEVSPSSLAEPGEVSVAITISNSGDTDMKDALTLYNPASEIVTDFGDQGSVILKAGEVKTWTGKWTVNQRTLDNGQIVFFVKYVLYDENGKRDAQSQPIRGKLNATESKTDIEVKRTISPGTAREGQTVTVKYDIVNTGTVSLKNITLQESKDISAKAVTVAEELKAGETAQVKLPVKMGKKDLTSSATITYTTGDSKEKQIKTVQEQKITYGEAAMTAKITSSAKGVAINGKVTLSLELKNNGSINYTDVRVTDEKLGDVFTNQELAAGATLKLDKEITLTETTDYQFHISAVDNTGTEVSLDTDSITISAVDPSKIVHLNVVAAADRTEVYTQPGIVRFTVTVENDSQVDAANVALYHGSTKIYTFPAIPAGESRSLTRDAALSMAGKYQFTAVVVDAMDNSNKFTSNEIQIAFSIPTPAPLTPTPPLEPTPEPTYQVITVPPISNPSVGTVPKLIRSVFYPMMIVGIILLVGAGILLVIATRKRMEQKRASDAALDHLDRAKRRDYATPGEEPEEEVAPVAKPAARAVARPTVAAKPAEAKSNSAAAVEEQELPHMKYVRNAYQRSGNSETSSFGKKNLYDDDPLTDRQGYGEAAPEEDLYHTYGSDRDLPEVPAATPTATAKGREASPYARRARESGTARTDSPAYRGAKDADRSAYRDTGATDSSAYRPDSAYDTSAYDDAAYARDAAYGADASYGDDGSYGQADPNAYPEAGLDYATQDGYVADPLGYGDTSGYADGQAAYDNASAYGEGGQAYAPGEDDAAADPMQGPADPYAGQSGTAGGDAGTERRSGRSIPKGRHS